MNKEYRDGYDYAKVYEQDSTEFCQGAFQHLQSKKEPSSFARGQIKKLQEILKNRLST